MNNPGLSVFAAPFVRAPSRPLDTHDDPLLEEDGNHSDFVRPVGFGRWKTPGHSLRFPAYQGPPFAPGEKPEDVIHGEIISPAEQDGADKILNGDHDSDSPSENPYVERARQDLHTSESSVAVHALSGLLSGASPSTVPSEAMDAAHEYLSKHFTGVRVNPHHGTLMAVSPTGAQMVKRHAISDSAATYSLTNKHGTFESKDPKKLVRAMLAFQILHNELAQKKNGDDQGDSNLAATSGFMDGVRGLGRGIDRAVNTVADSLYGAMTPRPNPSRPHKPLYAVFEPGHGTDQNDSGTRGGYVSHDIDAPAHWRRDSNGIAYSPGHFMNEMLDPVKATKPRDDPYFPGHTYTYAPSPDTGHTIERHGGGARYFVNRLHPATRDAGFDLPRVPKPPKPVKPPKPAKAAPRQRAPRTPPPPTLPPTTSAVKGNDLCPVCVSGYLEPYDSDTHECLNCGSLVKHVGFDKEASKKPPRGGLGRGLGQILPPEGDPLNLASGGSENPNNMDDVPLDGESTHPLDDEELDPGYIGYEAPRSILGSLERTRATRDGLRFFEDTEIQPPEFTRTKQPMIDLKRLHNERDDDDWDDYSAHHPGGMCETCWLKNKGNIVGELSHNEYISDHPFKPIEQDQRFSSTRTAGETDPLDEQLGKHGYFPIHHPGDSHVYVARMPGVEGTYARLTEGVPHPKGGWTLTMDNLPSRELWTRNGEPHVGPSGAPSNKMPEVIPSIDPSKHKRQPRRLPDLGDRAVGEKSVLATGTHPIDDDSLNRALRDVAAHGRSSETYRKAVLDTAYEPPKLPPERGTQQERRHLSSVGNPGLSRFSD